MSNDRRKTDVTELTFEQFVEMCATQPVVRVQGRNPPPTKRKGKGVRFNRSVEVLTDTAILGRWPVVQAERVQWNPLICEYERIGERMTLRWQDLDWVTTQASGDPNGTWMKVT